MTAADSVFCNNCGDPIKGSRQSSRAVDVAQWARTVKLQALGSSAAGLSATMTGRVNLQASGFSAAGSIRATPTLTRETIRRAVEKNCVLMIDYGIATVGGAWASYWTPNGLSVALYLLCGWKGNRFLATIKL